MSDDFLTIDPKAILDLARLDRKFGELATVLIGTGAEAAGKYILGILRKEIPPVNHGVTRKQAYGVTAFTAKQRRWMFANLFDSQGNIQYYKRRSPGGGVAASWHMVGSGANLTLTNSEPGAIFVYGDSQPRQLGLVGWKQIYRTVDDYSGRTTDSAARAIAKEIKRVMDGA